MTQNARLAAARVIGRVLDGCSLNEALRDCPADRDRALVHVLSYGTIRWYPRLSFILSQLLNKPFKAKDREIQVLALVGLYQLAYTRVKPHAAVSETVAAAGRKPWARSLLNAVLRRYQRESASLLQACEASAEGRTAHPAWIQSLLRKDWPEAAEQIMAAANLQAPMVLRINCQKTGRAAYLQRLAEAGIAATAMDNCDSAVRLESPVDVQVLPGFAEGMVSVQDSAAQLAAGLLPVVKGDRVLDLCAAPGGKTVHLLERYPELARLVAVDLEPERLQRVAENLQRARLDAALLAGNAADPGAWWDGVTFQKILVDAPCSASGVIRRHPDIKLLRRETDIAELVSLQRQILDAAWSMLAPGGSMLYATCSVFRQENDEQIAAFLERHDDAREIRIEAGWGHETGHGRQILTGEGDMDGFYYALMGKSA